MEKKKNNIIGVLGGMGPEASIEFYRRLIRISQTDFQVRRNEDYPFILIYAISPSAGMVSDKSEASFGVIIKGLKKLEETGVDFVAIPCNTVRLYINRFRKAINVPILSIIDETVEKVAEKKLKKVGIFGSKTTVAQGLYQNSLKKRGIESMVPNDDELEKLVKIIFRIIASENTKEDKRFLLGCINRMLTQGAEGIILGCTEIPLVVKQEDTGIPIFDTLEILAKACLREYYDRK